MRTIYQREFGGPEVLEIVERDIPEPPMNHVLVRVEAIGLNPVDSYIRSGAPLLGQPPFVLGYDVSGVVEGVGTGVGRLRVGEEVHGMTFGGTYAEYVCTPARTLVRKPASLTFEEAAALPLAGLTAWQALVDGARLEAGQRVLIHAAAGGVGHLAVQIAKSLGSYVIGTASAAKRDFVLGLGADEVIDYQTGDFEDGLAPVDVVLQLVNGARGERYSERSLAVIRPGGVLVTAVERYADDLAAAAQARGVRLFESSVESDYAQLQELDALVEAGRLRVHLDRVFPFGGIRAAHAFVDGGHVTGKVVVVADDTWASATASTESNS